MLNNMLSIVGMVCILLWNGIATADLNTGLVAHWNFDDCTATDVGPNGLNGTLNGNITCVDGVLGKAFLFDGSSAYINAGHSAFFDVNKHTVSAWVSSNKFDISNIILGKVNPFQYETINIIIQGGCLATSFATGSEINHLITSKTEIQLNKWYFVAVTYDEVSAKLYVDGQLNLTVPRAGVVRTGSNDLAIGRHGGDVDQGGGDYFFNGIIDNVRIYSRALNTAEVQQLYRTERQISGDIVGYKSVAVTCKNITTNTQVIFTSANTIASSLNCEKKGLVVNPGDKVSILVKGTAHQ